MEDFLREHLSGLSFATRLAHEQMGADAHVVVFFDVRKDEHRRESAGGKGWPWTAITTVIICLVLAYYFRHFVPEFGE
jgi:hypothetical protein